MDDELAPGIKDGEALDQLLARWEWFADELQRGYQNMYLDDFDFECWTRKLIHGALETAPGTRAQLDRLWEADNRVRSHVLPWKTGTRFSDMLQWWENVVPRKPNPDMLEELRSQELWPYSDDVAP